MDLLPAFYDVCLDNDFDDIQIGGDALSCNIRSFDRRYRLTASRSGEELVITLADHRPLTLTPPVTAFLRAHHEEVYPLRRTLNSPAEMQETLDDLQSAADDLLGFARDLAEKCHSADSAEAALKSNFSLRDTPREISQLDSLAVAEMRHRRTLWYPSAGRDFRDLIFCSGEYPGIDISPELFIHTDCQVDFDLDEPGQVYADRHTIVTLHLDREFDRLDVPRRQFAHWDCENAGRILLYQAEVVSDRFGKIARPLIYAVCENEYFAAELLVPNRVAVETVCHVRYGAGFGGAGTAGEWLKSALKVLHTRYYLSDPLPEAQDSDEAVRKLYPQLVGEPPKLFPGTVIPGKSWSDHGDVTVYEVR